MQTHSVILVTQIDFEYDDTRSSHISAIRKAINKTFSPDLKADIEKNIRVVSVRAMDPDSHSIERHWGEF